MFTSKRWLHQQCLGVDALEDNYDRHHVYGMDRVDPSFTVTQVTGHINPASYTMTGTLLVVDNDFTRAIWTQELNSPRAVEESWGGTRHTISLSSEPPPGKSTQVSVSTDDWSQACVEDPTKETLGSFGMTCLPSTSPILTLEFGMEDWTKEKNIIIRSNYNAATEVLVDSIGVIHTITSTGTLGMGSTMLPSNVFQVPVIDLPIVTHISPKSAPAGGSGGSSAGVTPSTHGPAIQYWHRRLPSLDTRKRQHRRQLNIDEALETPGM